MYKVCLTLEVQSLRKDKLASDSWKNITMFSSIYTFFTKHIPGYFAEKYVPIETNVVHTYSFIIAKIKCSSSKNRYWAENLILHWSLTLK